MQDRWRTIVMAWLLAALCGSLVVGCGDDNEPTASATATMTATPRPTGTPTPLPTDLAFYRNPSYPEDFANPLAHIPYPQHPFLAPNGRNNMHDDAYMSDTYEVSGPMARDAEVTLQTYAGSANNLCVTITFDSRDRILTTDAEFARFRTLLIDPESMSALGQYLLPARSASDPLFPYNDTSGAAYFALDNQDRVLLSDASNAIQIIHYDDAAAKFEVVHKDDLTPYVVPLEPPARDHVQMTLPDWNREGLLWFMTRYGVVGTLDLNSDRVQTIALSGEEIQNSFAIAEDGAYFVTDHAMYRFHADDQGLPVEDWRTEYDRGSRVKPGNINQGSGTTPKIFGEMVAIADNAEPRMNVLFLKRSDGSVACQLPVFGDDLGTTENAMPGFARQGPNGLEYSIIVENNYGKESSNLLGPGGACADSVGGVVRVDMVPDESGQYSCRQVWQSPEDSCSTVPKLSLANGLLYLYTYERLADGYGYYLTTVDFDTGATVYRQPTGTGIQYADFGAPLTLSPSGDTVFIGTLGGLLRVRDRG
jgi:streptogramin lyase